MSDKITHTNQVHGQYNANKQAVLWLTGMSEEELTDFMTDTGTTWLQQIAKEYVVMTRNELKEIIIQPNLWQWWKNEWCRRDGVFLNSLFATPDDERLGRYRAMHQDLFIQWKPDYKMMAKGFVVELGNVVNAI